MSARNKKILIVDDDASIRLGFQEIFENEGFQVSVCASADKACQIAHEIRPDVVIVDYYLLNDLSGIDICKFIKKDSRLSGTKIIMMTGVLTKNQAQKMMHFGFDRTIVKPVETENLLKEVRSLLTRA